MQWADAARQLGVRANADTPLDARTARSFGAEGVGLCRTEHMFFDDERIPAMWEMILADSHEKRSVALDKLLPFQRDDFVGIFREMSGLPVTIRLLDPPLARVLAARIGAARAAGARYRYLAQRPGEDAASSSRSSIPCSATADVGSRSPIRRSTPCRCAPSSRPRCRWWRKGTEVRPEIMIPLVVTRPELDRMRALVDKVAESVFERAGAGSRSCSAR